MKSLAILGGGGHGRVVADAALCAGWEKIVFFDEGWPVYQQTEIWEVVGDGELFFKQAKQFDAVIVGIGNNAVRLKLLNRLIEEDSPIATIIHPRATVSRFSRVSCGTVIFAGAVINPSADIGLGNIINTGASIDHDCKLGKGVHISPGARLAGNVSIGDCTWVGIGASVKHRICIGKNVLIGAGAAVVSDLPDDVLAFGVPAKIK